MTLDSISEKRLATLLPAVQPKFRAFLEDLKQVVEAKGLTMRVGSAHRTYAEQDALYAQGRTKPGNIVTKARGGQSNHNFGIAIDIDLFRDGKYRTDSPSYLLIGPVAERHGLEWGGNWKGFTDVPHVEYPTGLTMAQKRARVAKGEPLVHVPQPVPDQPTKVWSVEFDGEQIVKHCLDTPAVRAVAEALGATLEVNNKSKVITIHQRKA